MARAVSVTRTRQLAANRIADPHFVLARLELCNLHFTRTVIPHTATLISLVARHRIQHPQIRPSPTTRNPKPTATEMGQIMLAALPLQKNA